MHGLYKRGVNHYRANHHLYLPTLSRNTAPVSQSDIPIVPLLFLTRPATFYEATVDVHMRPRR